jgi:beta-glucosidase
VCSYVACGREYFAVYAETCFASFGDRVKNWITINEPLQTAVNGYDLGIFAPGRSENRSVEPYLAAHHQILAHAAAVSIYRSKYKVKHYTCFYYIYFV